MNISWEIKSPENYFKEGKDLKPTISNDTISGNIDFYIWSKTLKYIINFGEIHIDSLDKEKAIRKALIEIYQAKNISANLFLEKLKLNLKSVKARCKENKYLLSAISVNFPAAFNEIIFFDSSIKTIESFPDNSPIKKRYDKKKFKYTGIILLNNNNSNDIRFHLQNLNLFRALLCLHSNPGMVIDFNDDSNRRPINSIRLSNEAELINEKGELLDSDSNLSNGYMLEKHSDLKNKSSVINDCMKSMEKIARCKYNKNIKESLLLFVNSLDELDQDVAFVLFWNCLDKLSNSSKGNYDAVLNRVAALYSNPNYHKIVLENLKNIRNNFAHNGIRCKDAKHYCYILQSYYFHLLNFHLDNTEEFNGIEDAFRALAHLSKITYSDCEMELIVSRLKLRKPRAII